jgi:DMSO/TMAO reductase YedYZ molybdopterin-dependent catalytic subunit
MNDNPKLSRRQLLLRALGVTSAAASGAVLSGCEKLSRTEWFPKILTAGESVNKAIHKTFIRKAMAQEFTAADLSPTFRSNGTDVPDNPAYAALAQNQFTDWQLKVDGLVEKPGEYSLAKLRELPSRTQITRHDCVEGWSAIAKWKGARLAALLEEVKPKPEARFVVFHCADPMEANGKSLYYESIDMEDAFHVQTLLAYELNDNALPIANGAPVRLRVERQLGYKQAKYIMRIELVDSFARIAGGKGGYWEDQGYDWYAGI